MPGHIDQLVRTAVRVVSALRAAGVPFALTGGIAVWARGGPESEHDVDVLVREQDSAEAVRVLVAAGMRAAQPPETWLSKVYDGEHLVDLIHHPVESPVTDETLARAEWMRVGSVRAPVATGTDLVVDKMLVLDEHRCDFAVLLPVLRALREQIDWTETACRTAGSPFAEALLLLAHRLGIATLAQQPGRQADDNRPGAPAVRGGTSAARAG
ncbi:nucleotidyltransferase domain-containing protein [Allokutzneria oryzae]|uniref:Nucleotidyltransferase domain-containing protein n=1 Tax=Allokutzneria oryzae TaxID=1378989 RepID=A0ABV5ZP10_9PSEU